MKFPDGISDFYEVITEDYFYVDRTSHIRQIEEYGKSLLWAQPSFWQEPVPTCANINCSTS